MVLLLMSCEKKPVTKVIPLQNDMGVVSVKLQGLFNTYQESYQKSECGCCCDSHIYRYWHSLKDDVPIRDSVPNDFERYDWKKFMQYSFTITHPACSGCDPEVARRGLKNDWLQRNLDVIPEEYAKRIILLDTLESIHNNVYEIVAFRMDLGSKYLERMEAYTVVKSTPLKFSFKWVGTDTNTFLGDMFDILRGVEISSNSSS